MTTAPFRPTIRSQADLAEVWRTLMGGGGFSGHSVWMMWIVGDQPVPQVTEMQESEEPITGRLLDNFVEVLQLLSEDVPTTSAGPVRVAFLLSRPGPATIRPADRAWAATLYAAARDAGVPCETVHLATTDLVRPLPLDELD
jgi:hypothetical protein